MQNEKANRNDDAIYLPWRKLVPVNSKSGSTRVPKSQIKTKSEIEVFLKRSFGIFPFDLQV